MSAEERAVLELPPKMRQQMATLVLSGWRIKFDPSHHEYSSWTAFEPNSPAYSYGRQDLYALIETIAIIHNNQLEAQA